MRRGVKFTAVSKTQGRGAAAGRRNAYGRAGGNARDPPPLPTPAEQTKFHPLRCLVLGFLPVKTDKPHQSLLSSDKERVVEYCFDEPAVVNSDLVENTA